MAKYIRFVVAAGHTYKNKRVPKHEWRRWHPLSLTGIITIARLERDLGRFTKKESELIQKVFDWFNENIPCPPFSVKIKSMQWNANCIAWWRVTAKEPIAKLQPLIKLLRKKGMVVRTLSSDRLSNVKYRDKFQAVAEANFTD